MRTRRWPKIVVGVVLVVAAIAVAVYWYQRPLLLTGTGYAAHNACAVTHLADRDDPDTDLPPNPLVPFLNTHVSEGGATSSLLGVLAGQKAWYTPGYGCTVAPERPALPQLPPVDSGPNPFAGVDEVAPAGELDTIVARAFGDDLDDAERVALGTRAIVVVHRGAIVAERYADGFDASTPQLGWSMAKSVTNLLVGRLVQKGVVEVGEDHLRPEWDDERVTITIDDLMRMTSGLAWDETYSLGTPITKMLYLEPDMAGYVASQRLAHPVGAHRQYSSGSTNLLCAVLLDRAGRRADLLAAELFAPLGLSSARVETDGAGTPVCSSYVWATPRDWAVLGQFALQDGEWHGEHLLPEGWLAESTTALPADGEDAAYGAGWWVNAHDDGTVVDPDLPADAYWASGHDGQRMFVVPSADLVIVRLGFTPEADDDRTAELAAALVDWTAAGE